MKRWVLALVVCICMAAFSVGPSLAQESSLGVSVRVTGAVTSTHFLSATAKYTIENRGDKPVSRLSFLLFPNQFQTLSQDIPEYARQWIYPSGFSPGKMRIKKATIYSKKQQAISLVYEWGEAVDGNAQMVAQFALPEPLQYGQSVVIQMTFTVDIPTRRGRFGSYDGVVTLAGGWLPRLLPATDTIYNRPVPMALDASMKIPAGYGAFALNRVFPKSDDAQRIHMESMNVSEATLVLMDKMEVVTRTSPQGNLVFVSNQYTGLADDDESSQTRRRRVKKKQKKSSRVRQVERVFQIVESTRSLMVSYVDEASDVWIIEVPTWDRLAQVSESSLLLSTRAMQLIPHPKALLFHELDVVKNAAALVARPLVVKDGMAAPFAAEVVGMYWVGRYMKEVSHQKEDLAKLLRALAFNPYIDNLIYAPQIPYKYVYGRSIEEADWFRDELWRVVNELPRGKRVVAKLEDLLGQEGTAKFFDAYLRSSKTFAQTVDAKLPNGPQFRKQWFGAYPRVAYGIAQFESVPQAGQYIHRVTVTQSGEPVVEPVTVQLTDKAGNVQRLVWDGEGMSSTLEWISAAPLKKVSLDPDFRLVETALHPGHPLSDNAVPQRMRPPLLTQLLVWGDSVTLEPFVLASFTFKRQYDISNSFHLQGAYTPRLVGGAFSYYRYLGHNRTLNSRTWYAGPTIGVYQYKDAAVTEFQIPEENRYTATMASLTMTAGRDDTKYAFDPATGKAFQMSFGYAAGRSEFDNWVQHGKGSVRLFKHVSLALGHTLALYSGVGAVVGTPPASNLTTLSHRQILRGFDLGETYGKLSMYGVVEYRHRLLGATAVSFPLRTLVDRVQGVLFAGAGSASLPQNYHTLFDRERNFAEVGYGLRFHLLLFGAVPYLLAVDFAVPVYPTTREYTQLDATGTPQTYARAPFRFVLGITQTY